MADFSNATVSPLHQERAANTHRVRTRQGCWTCRRRRRKCDEGKPRCEKCIAKNLKCNYGVQLTFHDANLSGLDIEDARSLRKHSSRKYPRLQFVDGMDDIQEDFEQYQSNEDQTPLTPITTCITNSETQQSAAQNGVTDNADRFHAQYLGNGGEHGSESDFSGACDNQTTVLEQPLNTFIEPRVAGDIRLDIGHDNSSSRTYSTPIDPALMQNLGGLASYGFTSSPLLSSRLPRATEGANSHSVGTELAELTSASPLASHGPIADMNTYQDLLKLFIDTVAPWLDLCTQNTSYAIYLPLLWSRYNPLCKAVLALAAYHSSDIKDPDLPTTLIQSATESLGSDIYSGREEVIATRHLICIARLLPLPTHQWRSLLADTISSFNELEIHGLLSDIRGAACWLMLRFDLAAAMASKLPLVSDLSSWPHPVSPSSPPSHLHSNPVAHLQDSLLLCARVANLISQPTQAQGKLQSWGYLYLQHQKLQSSQSARMILPLLGSSIGDMSSSKLTPSSKKIPISFPLHIHTSRVSFYASFLSHFTSLLLIQSEPCGNGRAAKDLKAAPWYAVQICGLTLSNPLLWSWDPVVVAALIHAGLTLSFPGQQKELLKHLRSLEGMTGWDFGRELRDLEEVWRASC